MLNRALLFALIVSSNAIGETPLSLRENTAPNRAYSIRTQTDLAGTLTLPATKDKQAPKSVAVTGRSAVSYDERILPTLADGSARSLRIYRNVEFRRSIDDRPQESTIRPVVRRMVVLRRGTREVPFSPDGPLTFAEIDLVRTDVFTFALGGLLPGQAVNIGDRWPASLSAVEELTDLERIEQGGLECQLASITNENGKQLALVRFTGTIRGVNEDGPTRQELTGSYTFDLTDNLLAGISLSGVHSLLDKDGNVAGRIEGKFQLTRQVTTAKELEDAAFRGLQLEPNPDNTLLVYEGTSAGVRFTYPRRWRISAENGRQITLDGPHGNGVLITADALAKIPTAADYQKENQDFIAKMKGKVIRSEPPRRIATQSGEGYQFGMDIELNSQPARMEYFVVKQANGGATIGARLQPNEAATLRPEIEALARSLTITTTAPVGVVPLPGK